MEEEGRIESMWVTRGEGQWMGWRVVIAVSMYLVMVRESENILHSRQVRVGEGLGGSWA